MNDRIKVALGLTVNLGDFNSVRVDAGYETDVREGETLAEAYERAWDLVDAEVDNKVDNKS